MAPFECNNAKETKGNNTKQKLIDILTRAALQVNPNLSVKGENANTVHTDNNKPICLADNGDGGEKANTEKSKGKKSSKAKKADDESELDRNDDSTEDEEKTVQGKGRKKKLLIGECAKPDETGIKKVVKYPHELLNPKYVQVFSSLDSWRIGISAKCAKNERKGA